MDKNIFIIAGEQSSDIHGSGLVRELKEAASGFKLSFAGLGGDCLKSEGVNLLYHIRELSSVALIDVVKKIKFFKDVLKTSVNFVKETIPDIIVLIDYPGFNLRFAEAVRKFYKNKIIYYISPQVWAWNKRRVLKIRKLIDKMLVVFPFEVDFYKSFGVEAVYVGHPLVKKIKCFLENNESSKISFGGVKTVTILPGSRTEEIKYHLPVLVNFANVLRKEFDVRFNFSKASSLDEKVFCNYKKDLVNFNLTSDNIYRLIYNSDIILTKAGTSTIECALLGKPFLIFYKTSPLNYHLLKPLVKVNNLGMVNILSGKNIVKEFVQSDFTVDNLLKESRTILTNENYRNEMMVELKNIWNILGDGDASKNAAKIITSYL